MCTHFVRTNEKPTLLGIPWMASCGSRGARQERWCTCSGRRAFGSYSRRVPSSKWHAATVSQVRRAITEAKKMDIPLALHSGGVTLIYSIDGCMKPSATSPNPLSFIGCARNAIFSFASHVPLQEHACHASTTSSVRMRTLASSVLGALAACHTRPRGHTRQSHLRSIYLLT